MGATKTYANTNTDRHNKIVPTRMYFKKELDSAMSSYMPGFAVVDRSV